MTFHYTDPSDGSLHAIRFLVGDTDSAEAFLQDEEIDWLILTWSNYSVYYQASRAAQAIASKLTREVSITSDSQTLGTQELQQRFDALAASLMLQHQALLSGGNVDVGGINAGEQLDPSVTSPSFGTGMQDNVEAGQQDWGDYQDRPFRNEQLERQGYYQT